MIIAIIRHEIGQILRNPKTWYFLAAVQVMFAILFRWLLNNFLLNQNLTQIPHYGITEEVLHPSYGWIALVALLLLPIICSHTISQEKQRGTILNYYCTNITGIAIVLAKFISVNIILFCIIALLSIMPLAILLSGKLDWGQFIAAIFGTQLMLSAAIAIGISIAMFVSSTLRSYIAILFTLAILVMLEWLAEYTSVHALFLQQFGLLNPLKSFLAGIICIRHIAFYLMLTFVFALLAAWRYNKRCLDA